MVIKIDYLWVLKIINENKSEISLDMLYHKIETLNNKQFEMWTRGSFYSVIRTLKSEKYVTTRKTKKIPTSLMIKITKEAQDMIKIFEINGKDEKKNKIEEIKENSKKIQNPAEIAYPIYKGLEDDEISELTQEVGYKIIYCMDKEFEELTEKESERVRKSAAEIVEYIIKQIT